MQAALRLRMHSTQVTGTRSPHVHGRLRDVRFSIGRRRTLKLSLAARDFCPSAAAIICFCTALRIVCQTGANWPAAVRSFCRELLFGLLCIRRPPSLTRSLTLPKGLKCGTPGEGGGVGTMASPVEVCSCSLTHDIGWHNPCEGRQRTSTRSTHKSLGEGEIE